MTPGAVSYNELGGPVPCGFHESLGCSFAKLRFQLFCENWTISGFLVSHVLFYLLPFLLLTSAAWHGLKPGIQEFLENWTILGLVRAETRDSRVFGKLDNLGVRGLPGTSFRPPRACFPLFGKTV